MTPSTGLLTINLSAIANNWQRLNEALGPKVDCAAVVKANAYGLGVVPVARALYARGCRHFFVASLDEAVELRSCLDTSVPIFVFGGLVHGLGTEWQNDNLIPVLCDIVHIEQWLNYCQQHHQQLPCIIKIDTGMHRLGVLPNELIDFVHRLPASSALSVVYLLSHLACADEPEHPQNTLQLDRFRQVTQALSAHRLSPSLSLANSSGIFLGEDYHFDLARPGAALYGVNPTPGKANPMEPVVTLELPVMQCRNIAAGESVGYGATYTAEKPTRLATVFGGYGDGLFRCLSNLGQAYCAEQLVSLVGRVSMDSMVFDIGNLSEDPKTLQFLNARQDVNQVAKHANTIAYEVLTNLGQRYRRRYIEN
ncbi:MAG: alanine racemase [Pseudomonadota bacterium]